MSFDSIATHIGTSTGASTGAAANNSSVEPNKKQKMSPPFDSLLLADGGDLLIHGILPFVGVGQYAFIAAVKKKMNKLYKEYCKVELKKNPATVKDRPGTYCPSRSAESTDTLCSKTFCNQPRAEYWLKDKSSNKKPDHCDVCNAIATVGNLTVMKWAQQQRFAWDETTCWHAAKNGHLEMLQWLRENGCPWDKWTCTQAAQRWTFGDFKVGSCKWLSMECRDVHFRKLLQVDIWNF
ncbi:ankyrin repeat protein [Seminavis robusta]|uniref:Ankyrin repeat protein n=1 Tax=Seminavis robusta TaxID=568900 RepID=A0A9N8HSC4_9STRA|nr:ankyrin repeat protein [Seminavis robusta]|eukprot:Sro1152_g246970.1 ankyrin repeat protein (237) ;mRNA; f:33432-34142